MRKNWQNVGRGLLHRIEYESGEMMLEGPGSPKWSGIILATSPFAL